MTDDDGGEANRQTGEAMATDIRDLARLLADMDTDERLATFRHTGAWYGIVTILDYLVARDGMDVGRVDTMAGQGTPTPIETAPGPSEKDTLMERSIDKDEEEHPHHIQKNFLKSDLSGWDQDVGLRFSAEEHPPTSPKKFYKTEEYLRLGELGELNAALAFGRSAPEKISEIGARTSVSPVSGVVGAAGSVDRVSEPDNGPDGAFGPDVVEVDVDLGRDIRKSIAEVLNRDFAGDDLIDGVDLVNVINEALARNGL